MGWHKTSEGTALYAWAPEPPDRNFVALGMIFTTSPDAPPKECVRCVDRRWLIKASQAPQKLWDDRGLPGKAGSLWTVNNMQLVVATAGYQPPPGPFYELIEWPFYLSETPKDTPTDADESPT